MSGETCCRTDHPGSRPTPIAIAAPHPWRWSAALFAAAAALLAFGYLEEWAAAAVAAAGLARGTGAAEALLFFLYEAPKVLLLLAVIVFALGVVQTWFSPARTRRLLAGRREGAGNLMAAALGVVTPFCSCSAVPLFMGLLTAGVPLGVTFSFLVSAPMVNEVALGLLFALFGWKIAALYLGLGLAVAILAGWIIGRLKLEGWLEDWVREAIRETDAGPAQPSLALGWAARLAGGRQHMKSIVGKVWPYVLAGIGVGALVHGYVPQDFMASFMGKEAWWAVPAAVLLGVPLYAGAAGIIPVVQALLAKGAALGTVLAFMMSVIGLSLPEFIILRKVLQWKLIALFAGVVATGILLVGYVFNLVL